MNILVIAPLPHPTQINAHPAPWVISLIDALSKRGVNIEVLNNSHLCEKDEEIFFQNNIKYTFLKTLHPKIDFLFLYRKKIKIINNWILKNQSKFDLIHIFGNEHQYELLEVKQIHIPIIMHIQGIISECRRYYSPKGINKYMWILTSFYEKRGYKNIDIYSCRTDWDKSVVKKYNSSARIFHIWEMIRKQFFAFEKTTYGKDILFIGGTNPIKRLELALKAFNLFKKINKTSKLIVIGNSDDRYIEELMLINNLDIDKNDYELLGFQNEDGIIEAYKRSFCLLHPSIIDNSPNSICEAQICGLPVIATNVGGVSSLIKHGETGYLTSDSAYDINNYLLSLYDDKIKWEEISDNSKKEARKRHSAKEIAEKTINMYETVINEFNK